MFSLAVYENLLTSSVPANSSDLLRTLANNVLVSSVVGICLFSNVKCVNLFLSFLELMFQGTTAEADLTNYLDPGIGSNLSIYNIQPQCILNATLPFSFEQPPLKFEKGIDFSIA